MTDDPGLPQRSVSIAFVRSAVRALDDAARAAADRTPLRRARHLLVGYAVCDACGGPVATARTREGRESVPAYLCAWRRDRGPEVCTARWTRSTRLRTTTAAEARRGESTPPRHGC